MNSAITFKNGLGSIYVQVCSKGDNWSSFVNQPEEESQDDFQNLNPKQVYDKKLSKLFDQDQFSLPPQVQQGIYGYVLQYQKYRATRTLRFRQEIGCVSLTLHFDNCSKDFEVSPFEASIICHFSSENSVTKSINDLKILLASTNQKDETYQLDEQDNQKILLQINQSCEKLSKLGILTRINQTKDLGQTSYSSVKIYEDPQSGSETQNTQNSQSYCKEEEIFVSVKKQECMLDFSSSLKLNHQFTKDEQNLQFKINQILQNRKNESEQIKLGLTPLEIKEKLECSYRNLEQIKVTEDAVEKVLMKMVLKKTVSYINDTYCIK